MASHCPSADDECSAPIELINALHDVFASAGVQTPLDMPQIAVIGTKRSDKNSLIENVVGRDFISTVLACDIKLPLILQLIYKAPSKQQEATGNTETESKLCEWGEFLHLPGQRFYDFDRIRQAIDDYNSVTNMDEAIFSAPMSLTIYSPYVVTLTLVDLPTLPRVDTSEEPTSVEEQMRRIVLDQIAKPKTIILAAIPKPACIAESECLRFAKKVDANGERTIGVLLEADTLNNDTNTSDVLAGKVHPLRMGYHSLFSRRNEAAETKGEARVSSETEKQFVGINKACRDQASRCRTTCLAMELRESFTALIGRSLPEIKKDTNTSLAEHIAELNSLSDSSTHRSGTEVVLTYVSQFGSEYRTTVESSLKSTATQPEDTGRLGYIFHNVYRGKIEAIGPSAYISDVDIRSVLYCCAGSHLEGFTSTAAFEVMAKSLAKKLEDPSIQCLSYVHGEMVRILEQSLKRPAYQKLPGLEKRIREIVLELYERTLEPTAALLRDLVAMEACYINIHHPDSLDSQHAATLVSGIHNYNGNIENNGFSKEIKESKEATNMQSEERDTPRDKMSQDVEIVKLLLASHFGIIRQAVIDMVPKAIVLKFVNPLMEDMTKELVEHIYHSPQFEIFAKESEDTSKSRKRCEQNIDCLTKASQIIAAIAI